MDGGVARLTNCTYILPQCVHLPCRLGPSGSGLGAAVDAAATDAGKEY